MSQGQNWVAPEHSRPGIAHNAFDLFASVFLITMNRAFGASGFLRAKTATLESFGGVSEQLGALGAKRSARRVVGTAVAADH